MGADAKAPTVSIETVLIVRPIKVGGIMFGLVALLMDILATGSAEWVKIGNGREGIWEKCIYNETDPGLVHCGMVLPRGDWIMACQGLCIISLFLGFAAIIVSTKAVNNMDFKMKYKLYWGGISLFFLAVAFQVISLVIFPLKFLEENEAAQDESDWSFGWAYIVGWAAAGLQFIAGLFFLLDRGAEELVERERVEQEDEEEAV